MQEGIMVEALLDNGATGLVMSSEFAKKHIYYQGHRERTEIDVIREQKWLVILGMPWLACHNPEIDWRTEEVKMTRCPEECEKQWRPVQGKSGWEK